jgi:hypothetical protein
MKNGEDQRVSLEAARKRLGISSVGIDFAKSHSIKVVDGQATLAFFNCPMPWR